MWDLLGEGILYGLTLAMMLGPIFIALTETSISKGFRAGIGVALGVWISDFLFIALSFFIFRSLDIPEISDHFRIVMGAIGGSILMGMGIFSIRKKPSMEAGNFQISTKTFWQAVLKGFLVNTINPFTFIFWITLFSTMLLTRKLEFIQALWICVGLLGTIILTDTAKVGTAKILKKRLTSHHVNIISKTAGLGLLLFGIYMLGYTIWWWYV